MWVVYYYYYPTTYGRCRMRSYIFVIAAEENQDSISADLDKTEHHTVLESVGQLIEPSRKQLGTGKLRRNRLVCGRHDKSVHPGFPITIKIVRDRKEIVRDGDKYLIWSYRDRNPLHQGRSQLSEFLVEKSDIST